MIHWIHAFLNGDLLHQWQQHVIVKKWSVAALVKQDKNRFQKTDPSQWKGWIETNHLTSRRQVDVGTRTPTKKETKVDREKEEEDDDGDDENAKKEYKIGWKRTSGIETERKQQQSKHERLNLSLWSSTEREKKD